MSDASSGFQQQIANFQQQVVEAIQANQDAVVEAVRSWAGSVSQVPNFFPVPEGAPTPGEVVENAFSFAERMLALQREFVERIVDATTPNR